MEAVNDGKEKSDQAEGDPEADMIDLINFVVMAVVMFIAGLASHSIYLHEKERHGWEFPWDHDKEEEE